MSQENEVVRALLWDGVDAIPVIRDDTAWISYKAQVEPFVEAGCAFVWIFGAGQRIEVVGLDESRQVWLDWFEPWESVHNEFERLIPVGDQVISVGRQHGRLAGTQNEVEMLGASVFLMRDGRVARVEHYANRAEAFEAVGLRE